jgi:hypothetical protein
MNRTSYEVRAVRPLPRRVHGPLFEYPIGIYPVYSDACLALSWWHDLRSGLSGFRGEAYVTERPAVAEVASA